MPDQGRVLAQTAIALSYEQGLVVPQDFIEAHKWWNLAASRSSGDSHADYAKARDRLARQMTPHQVGEAQKRAREWAEAFEARRNK